MSPRTMGGIEVDVLWAHRRAILEAKFAADAYDRARDAMSEARYVDDPQAENDSLWRETLPEKGCA